MIKLGRAIAANTDLLTAQAFVYPKRQKNGQTEYLFLVISADGEDIFTQIRQKGLQLEEWFFDSPLSITEKFTQACQTLEEHLKSAEKLEFVLGFLQDKGLLYVQYLGEPKVNLARGGQLIDLLENFAPRQLISGLLEEADKVLVATSQVENPDNKLPTKFIRELLTCSSENLEDTLEMYYQKNSLLDPIASVLIDNPPETTEESPDFNPINSLNQQIGASKINIKLPLPKIDFKSRKVMMILGLMFILLLASGFFVNLNRQKQQVQNQQFELLLARAQTSYQKAKDLKEVSPEDSTKALVEAKENLNNALKVKPNDKKALSLKQEFEQGASDLERSYKVTDWPIFLSLDLIKSNFAPKKMSYSLDQVLLFDPSQKTLVSLNLNNKTNQILAGVTQLGDAKGVSLNGDTAFVYSEDKGVLKIDLNTNKITTIIKSDSEWGKVGFIYAFAGNVYLLDIFKNQIWKYVPIQNGYSNKFAYLKEGQNVDFAGSKDMTIDSSIWVFKQGPEIFKFTSGVEDNFSPGGLEVSVKELKAMFVSETEDRVYLLDSENSRLLVLKKNGEYFAQYVGDKFKSASGVVVAETQKKIYLLEGTKIYQLDLR